MPQLFKVVVLAIPLKIRSLLRFDFDIQLAKSAYYKKIYQ